MSYDEHRLKLAEFASTLKPEQIHEESFNGYRLVVSKLATGENTWDYTQGDIYDQDGNKLFSVIRNYHRFWFQWVGHPNGNTYFLCGEDYQGYSVINLTEGTKLDLQPGMAGYSFCWDDVFVSPGGTKIAVYGCYWASSYELRIYDFSDPTNIIFPQLETGPKQYWENLVGWKDDNTCYGVVDKIQRKSDGRIEDSIMAFEAR